ncbi:hypothetical protein SK128_003254 [Halocaridina rubra]|uniref:Uncharacterized protein n=1 Tax=Halocaridina rubra TaxID=373956 RepID=A0AAN9A2L9_HALRR
MSFSTQRKPYSTRPQFSNVSSNIPSDSGYKIPSIPALSFYPPSHPQQPLLPANPHIPPQSFSQPQSQVIPPFVGWIEFPITVTTSSHPQAPSPSILNPRFPVLRMSAPHLPLHSTTRMRRERCPYVPLPNLTDASFSIGYYVPPSVVPGDPYGGMQKAWKQHFENLFQNLPHTWMFGPIDGNVTSWFIFRDMAKVRYSCQELNMENDAMKTSFADALKGNVAVKEAVKVVALENIQTVDYKETVIKKVKDVVMKRANPLIRQALDKEKTVVISGISESQEPTWQGRLEQNKARVVDLIRKLGVVCGPEDIVNIHQLGKYSMAGKPRPTKKSI